MQRLQAEHPDFNVRRVDASGAPSGDVVDVGGQYAATLRLNTLEDGSWLAETFNPVTPSAQQRFDKHGRALGTSFQAQGVRRIGDGLERQGMVLAWMQGNAVMTQRYLAP